MHNKKTAIYNIYNMRERERERERDLYLSGVWADICINISKKGAKLLSDSSKYQISEYNIFLNICYLYKSYFFHWNNYILINNRGPSVMFQDSSWFY